MRRSGRWRKISSKKVRCGRIFFSLLILVLFTAGGCLDRMSVPVVEVEVEIGLNDTTGEPVILNMTATPTMINALKAPKASSTVDFPSVSAVAIHNFKEVGYWGAAGYTGPGSYAFTLGFPSSVEMNEGDTIVVEVRITDAHGDNKDLKRQHIEWGES